MGLDENTHPDRSLRLTRMQTTRSQETDVLTRPSRSRKTAQQSALHGPDRKLVLWKSRCNERILTARDPRGSRKESLMRCMHEMSHPESGWKRIDWERSQ